MRTPNRRRAATQQLLAAYSSVLLNVINGIVLVPYYFRFFDIATYGSWLACQNVVTWLALVELGFNLVFTHRLVQDGPAPDRFPETVGSGLFLTAMTAIAAALVGAGLAACGSLWMPTLLGANGDNLESLRLGLLYASIGVALTMMQAAFTAIASSWLDAGRTGAIGVIALACGIATTFVALSAGAGVSSLGLAAVVRGVVGALGSGVYIAVQYRKRGHARMRVSRAALGELLRTLAFPGLARVLSTIAQNSEATVAAAFVGPTAAAVLGLSSRLYDVGRVLLVPISYSVFSPFADVMLREGADRARALYKELVGMVLGLSMLLLASAVAVNASFVRVWLAGDVYVGGPMSLALAIAIFAYTFANLQSVLVAALGRIRESAVVSIVDTAARVAGLIVLTSSMGILGIPMASMIASAISIALCYRLLARGLATNVVALVPWTRFIALAVAFAAAAFVAAWIEPAGGWPSLVLICVPCGAFALAYTLAVSRELREHGLLLVSRLIGAKSRA
jgi:O-antigen/teichoic acid export membrane protein